MNLWYQPSGFLPNSDIGARDPISVYPDIGSDIGALFSSSDIGVPPISEYSGYRITWYRVLWYRSIPDIGWSWYPSKPDIVVSDIRIYRYHRTSDIGDADISIYGYRSSELWYRSFTDIMVPNIIADITGSDLRYRIIYGCHYSWYRSFTDIRVPDVVPDVSLTGRWLSGCARPYNISRGSTMQCIKLY